jgi:hypothetical protein
MHGAGTHLPVFISRLNCARSLQLEASKMRNLLCGGPSNHDNLDQIVLNLHLIFPPDQINITFDQMGTRMMKIKPDKNVELS